MLQLQDMDRSFSPPDQLHSMANSWNSTNADWTTHSSHITNISTEQRRGGGGQYRLVPVTSSEEHLIPDPSSAGNYTTKSNTWKDVCIVSLKHEIHDTILEESLWF